MNFTCICFGILFFVFGILFFMGKAHIHFAAWKTISDEEKEKIKIMPICRNIGIIIISCGLLFLAGGLWKDFKDYVFIWAMIGWMIVAALDAYYINKSKRYIEK